MKYKCLNIEVHNGELREVHRNLLNKVCRIHSLYEGVPAVIDYAYCEDDGFTHRVTTSRVKEWCGGSNRLIIKTKNSTYTFEQLLD